MTDYFVEKDYYDVMKQKKRVWRIYLCIAALYLVLSVGLFLWYRTLPYMSPKINTVKFIHYSLTVVMTIFSFIYIGIYYKRVNRFYKLSYNLLTGLKETSTGSFLEYDETLQDKDGVDFKSLIFIEWNKYKKDFYERKVLVFDERPFPEFKENQNVKYVTQGNVLISYEILS